LPRQGCCANRQSASRVAPRDPGPIALVELAKEVLDQEGDILAPRSERRYLQHHPAQAVVEIIAEGPAFDRGLEVAMGRGDEPALLTGYEESPSVSTTGRGAFIATIAPDGVVIHYRETFSGLQGTVTQSHINVGQLGVNGSVVIFLCQTTANPDPTGLAPACPQQGNVQGTITAANVIAGATASQQLAAGDLPAVIAAIRAGAAYVNVHTTLSPGGEIRGQIRTIAK
jgi:hypothetical protein